MNFVHKTILFFFNFLYPLKIINKENVPKYGAIFCCNHFSALDCGYVAKVYNKDIYFMAKKELFKNKFVGGIIKSFGAIPIDRDNVDMKSMLECLKVIKNKHKLVIFPEGTRNKVDDNLQPLKSGSTIFSVKGKTPIVPMAILKKAKFLRKNYLLVGEPIYFEEFYGKKLTEEDIKKMDEILAESMRNLHKELKEKVQKKKK